MIATLSQLGPVDKNAQVYILETDAVRDLSRRQTLSRDEGQEGNVKAQHKGYESEPPSCITAISSYGLLDV